MAQPDGPPRDTLPPRPALWLGALIALAAALAPFAIYEVVVHLALPPDTTPATIDKLQWARGLAGATLLCGVVGWYLLRHRLPAPAHREPADPMLPVPLSQEAHTQQHAAWLVGLRWIACLVGLAGLLALSGHPQPAGIGLPITELTICILVLAAGNAAFLFWLRTEHPLSMRIELQSVFDLLLLTVMLHFAGSIDTPVAALYVLHVIIANIMLPRRSAVTLTVLAFVLFVGLVLGEASGLIEHRALSSAHPTGMQGHADLDWLAWLAGSLLVLAGTGYLSSAAAAQLRQQRHQLRAAVRVAMTEREKLERGLDAAGAGLLLVDEAGDVVWASKRVIGTFHDDDAEPCQRCPRCAARRALAEDRPVSTEFALRDESGQAHHYRATASPLRGADADLGRIVEVIQDVTVGKTLEQEVVRAGRMAALGRLAAVVAHEVGNPLASLQARLSLLERSHDADFTRASIPVLREQVQRMLKIVHGLSRFARPCQEESGACNVNDVVREAIDFLQLDPRARDVNLELDLTGNGARVLCERDELSQLLLNLALNAVQAAGQGGTVRLSTTVEDEMVTMRVADSGPGVPPENNERVFEPFFTTKSSGFGLGLAISRSIARAHGGDLRYDLEAQPQPCFVMTLPVRRLHAAEANTA